MAKIRSTLKRIMLGTMVLVQVFFYPATSFATTETAEQQTETAVQTAEESTSEGSTTASEELVQAEQTATSTIESSTQPPSSTSSTSTSTQGPQGTVGPSQPNGAGSKTYVYNEETGLWENDYYTWDPVTKQTKPKQQQEYSYNPQTGMWDTTEWAYNPATNKYEENTYALNYNPNALAAGGSSGVGTINNTGPGSNNTLNFGGTSNGSFDLFFDARITNIVRSNAQSGDATLQGNTLAGNALTGDALAIVNILNMLQSAWGSLGSDNLAMFTANIDGDVTGDLYIDPSQAGGGSPNGNLDVNIEANGQINNDVEVNAGSGNATVNGNTTGGNATTGNAYAVVNLINMINSAIIANKSFIGLLNINGNFNGDILLPPGMLEAIIAATGPNSTNSINHQQTNNANVNVESNRTINNDLNVDASSGNATVANNTTGGNATTGRADTSIVLLNLTGQTVVAKNALLVFVNVLGSWVGLIMNAPAGTYAVAATGPDSTNTINAGGTSNTDVNIRQNSEINNDVSVAAATGDAAVTDNTTGGNATSGNASASINALNMIDSSFRLSDWFGILFINVFGNWFGSFGIDTEAGNTPNGGMGSGSSGPRGQPAGDTFAFVPGGAASGISNASRTTYRAVSGASTGTSSTSTEVNVASEITQPAVEQAASTTPTVRRNNIILPILGGLAALLILGGERLLGLLRFRK